MDQIGKLLVGAGLGIAALGALLWLGQGIPWLRLGRLPGDISIQRDGYSIFLPVTTMVLVSIFASLIFWLIAAVRR